ncbi:MAG: helix-hairpin-helix domain-containing protein [Anaerolineales bacterium]
MKSFLWLVAGILIGLLAAGVILIAATPPAGEPVTLAPLPTPPLIAVYVSGEVAAPGVYTLPENSRIQDALTAAGGPLETADLEQINLAQVVSDGEKLNIPKRRPDLVIGGNVEAPPGTININTATQAQLETLPGIGPTLAQRIIAYRTENGRFTRIEDLLKVSGVSNAILDRIRNQITVGP